MAKIKNWRLALVAVCLVALLGMLSAAFVSAPPIGGVSPSEPQVAHAEGDVATVGGTPYQDLNAAIEAAQSGSTKTVVLTADATISTELTIPEGVTLIVPYNKSNPEKYKLGESDDAKESSAENTLSWCGKTNATPIYTLTIDSNATVRVRGTFAIGGMTHNTGAAYSGATRGEYSKCVIDGKVIVEDKGNFEIYGLVTGTGGIQVESGGKLLQPFVVLDYKGGNATKSFYEASVSQSPFSEYSFVNVQCDKGIIVKYKGVILADCELYTGDVSLGGFTLVDARYNHATVALLSYRGYESDSTSLIELTTEQSQAEIIYKEPKETGKEPGDKSVSTNLTKHIGRTKITLSGGADANAMHLKIKISGAWFDISTSEIFAFPVPYNWDIELKDGTYSLKCNFKIMPGARLTIGNNATLDMDASFYVYDGLEQGPIGGGTQYPTAAQLQAANYPTNGELFIDGGMLNIKSGMTFLGAVQTTGNTSSKIVAEAGAVLSGTIKDGARTEKLGSGFTGCNYVQMDSSARVCGLFRGIPNEVGIEAGKTYTAVNNNTWTLKQPKGQKCDGVSHSKDTHNLQAYDVNANIAAPTMIGYWKVEHDENAHVVKWDYVDESDKAPTESERTVKVKHYCDELGCEHYEERTVLYAPTSLGELTYKGTNFTDGDINALFEELYGKIGDVTYKYAAFANVAQDSYNINIALPSQYSWRVDNSYKDNFDTSVKVVAKALAADMINGVQDGNTLAAQTYTGSAIKPAITLKSFNDHEMKMGEDYQVSYGENINATQDGTVTITGIGNFAGEIALTFDIAPFELTNENTVIGISANYTFTGSAIKPIPSSVKTSDNKFTLEVGDYDISYSDGCVDSGDHTITISGKGNFGGSATKTYAIDKANMENVKITLTESSYEYTGAAIKPEFTAKLGEYVLQETADYAISYSDNTSVGHVVITLTGAGKNFEGSNNSASFDIVQRNISGAEITVGGEYVYDREQQTVRPEDITIKIEGVVVPITFDIVGYESNLNAGHATVEIKGKGSFTGSANGSFDIAQDAISSVAVNGTYTYSGAKQAISLTVKTLGGLTLSDDEYTADYGGNELVSAATGINVTVTPSESGAANFTGSASTTFDIERRDISAGTLAMAEGYSFAYTGEAQIPARDRLVISGVEGFENADILESDVIITVTDNVAAGVNAATVTVEGKDNFKGTLTAKFSIDKKKITVNAKSASKTYGDVDPALEWTIDDGQIVDADKEKDVKTLLSVHLSRAEGQAVKDGGYAITGTGSADNYDIKVEGATFTINKKPVTVTLKTQTWAVYTSKPQQAKSDSAQWELKSGFAMAFDEQTTELNVKLAADGTSAQSYSITPSYDNGNYEVSFEYAGQKVESAAEGAFVIAPLPITVKAADITKPEGDEIVKTFDYVIQGPNHFFEQDEEIFKQHIEIGCAVTSKAAKDLKKGDEFDIVIDLKDVADVLTNYSITKEDGKYRVTDSIFAGVDFVDGEPIVYDGAYHKLEVNGLKPEIAQNATVKYTYHTGDGDWKQFPNDGVKDAATYTIQAEITVTGHESTFKKTATLTIDSKDISGATVSVGGSHTYTGREITLAEDEVTVTPGEDWTDKITFNFSLSNNINAGDADISVEGVGNYTGKASGTFRIDPRNISEGGTLKMAEGYSFTYTGKAQTPQRKDIALTLEGFDADDVTFDITASDNIGAGTATVTITGTGNFTGELASDFTINKAALTLTVTPSSGIYGTAPGEMSFELSGVVNDEEAIVRKAISITHTAEQWSDVGSYDVVVVTGELDNYTVKVQEGSDKQAYEVLPKSIADAKVTLKDGKQYFYTGEAVLPNMEDIELELDGYSDVTFELSSTDNTSVGKKALTLTGTDNYTGTATSEFEIEPARIDSFELTAPEGGYVYNGSAQAPVITVKAGKLTLKAGEFTVKYSRDGNDSDDLISAGAVRATVTANGNFEGELSKDFEIAKKSIDVTLMPQSAIYGKSMPAVEQDRYSASGVLPQDAQKLGLEIGIVAEGEGWNVGKYDLTVEIGNSNYTLGKLEGGTDAFEIKAKEIEVTLKTQNWATYNGETQNARSDSQYWEVAQDSVFEGDELGLTISGSGKNAGDYELGVSCSNANYSVKRAEGDNAKLHINRRALNIKVLGQTAKYNAKAPVLDETEGKGWQVTEGEIVEGEDIGVRLSASLTKDVNTYPITADWTDKTNYDVAFDLGDAKFEVTPATITVTVHAKSSVYGDEPAALTATVEGIFDEDAALKEQVNTLASKYLTLSTSVTKTTGVGQYDIVCNSEDPANYTFDIVNNVKYEVQQRRVKVELEDQQGVYGFGKQYELDGSKWKLTEGELVNGDALEIVLHLEQVTGAGSYNITGENKSANYDVDFEDATYTVAKRNIGTLSNITLSVAENVVDSSTGSIRLVFEGKPLELVATASFIEEEGAAPKQLATRIKVNGELLGAIDAEGSYTVVVELEDDNYEGSRTFKVLVVDESGITPRVYEALARLEALVGEKKASDVGLGDFDLVQSIAEEISALDSEERASAAARLEKYTEYIDAYNQAAATPNEVILTARNVTDSPIEGFYGAVAAISAFAALAYIALKGGRLI